MQALEFQTPKARTVLRATLLLTSALAALALTQFREQITAEELLFTSVNFRTAHYAGYVFLGLLLVLNVISWTKYGDQILQLLAQTQELVSRFGGIALPIFGLLLAFYRVLVLGFYGRFLLNAFPRLFLYWLITLFGASLLAAWRNKSWLVSLPLALVLTAALHNAAGFFHLVSSYPFSLGWSEISRYYQASFYFGEKVYDLSLALPVTHPSRYMLQSLPFLFESLPLWAHRLWQALLWVGMATATAYFLLRRLKIKERYLAGLFLGWAYLFLMQGAVFYHLLPCVILVMWGFDRKRFWRSLIIVGLASAWAGISRINWVPLPAALAALLYFIETPWQDSNRRINLKYLGKPLVYFLMGSIVALASYALYIVSSGNEDIGQFASPFTSSLLWDRLWPSAAFPTGILPGILLVSAPLLTIMWLRLRVHKTTVHWMRLVGIVAILLVFFFGGLVVSVKIGGGTNLHNLDAYMVLLLVAAAHFAFGVYAVEKDRKSPAKLSISWPLVFSLLIVPILFTVLSGGPLQLPVSNETDEALEQIQAKVTEALEAGTQVLFISQRHLLTFKMIDAPLVHDYEKLFLMEMAISLNDPYLLQFADDMDNWRFGLIISDPLHRNIKDVSEDSLAAENNAWVRLVSRPILCAYRPALTFSELSIQVLEPRYGSKCNQ